MKLFNEPNDMDMTVDFTITEHGVTHTLSATYDDGTPWHTVLDHVVSTLEAHYGYSFDLHWESEVGTVGVYYRGKEDSAE